MKKSILALLLAVLMVASLLPAAALADEPVEVSSYSELVTALSTAANGTTIKLTDNIELGANGLTNISGKTLTIDGNYKTITFKKTGPLTNGVFGNDTAPLYEGTQLTVKNLTIENTGDNGAYASIVGYNANGAGITYSGCTFKNLYAAVYVNPVTQEPDRGMTVEITGCTYTNTLYEVAVDKISSGAYVDAVKVTTSDNTGSFSPSEPVSNVVYAEVGGHTKAFSTIQAAVDKADDNSTITVAPGTYSGNVVFGGKSLTLNGNNAGINPNTTQRNAETIITGTFSTSRAGNETSTVDDQSITIDGFKFTGNGLKVGDCNYNTVEYLTVQNCIMEAGNNLDTSDLTDTYGKNLYNYFVKVTNGTGTRATVAVKDNLIRGEFDNIDSNNGVYPIQLWYVKEATVTGNVITITNNTDIHQAINISLLDANAKVTVNNNTINGAAGGIYVTNWKCGGDTTGTIAFTGTVDIKNNTLTDVGTGNFKPIFVGYEGAQNGAFEGTLNYGGNTNNGATVIPEVGQKPGATAYYEVTYYPNNGGDKMIQLATHNQTINLPAAPSKSGYAFLGWSDGTTTYAAGAQYTVTADTTFTASWVRHPDTEYVPEPEEPEEPETPVFPFYDVPASAWYYTAVKYVYDNKLMDGVDTYVFAPNDTLTRAMVWTIIARMSGVDTTGGSTWYAKAQEWVITNGISDGENPTAAITRQELVTMLYRYAQIKGYDVSVGESTNILSYVDATSISEYAMSAFQWACGSGLTEGDENGALTPLATATRAQAAAMIMRFLSK